MPVCVCLCERERLDPGARVEGYGSEVYGSVLYLVALECEVYTTILDCTLFPPRHYRHSIYYMQPYESCTPTASFRLTSRALLTYADVC